MKIQTIAALTWMGAVTAPMPLAGQDLRPGIAVLAFEDGGSFGQDPEDFAALERGIPGMLISELSRHPDARLVDRSETQRLLDEQDMATHGRVDATTAARVGKLVGARYMVFGTFVDLYGRFRVDARIVDVETGDIIHVATANDDREELFDIIVAIADEILADVDLPPLPDASANGASTRDVPTEALTFYSRALLYQDRGDATRAVEYYRRALEVFPAYTEAEAGLQQITAGG